MTKYILLALTTLFLSACSTANKAKPIDYTSPCACYEIIKITKNKG
ncbi:hypothetical protein [Campylobacter troglodytis]|nr:hypothetical protein [Campylobacter troglodytis]